MITPKRDSPEWKPNQRKMTRGERWLVRFSVFSVLAFVSYWILRGLMSLFPIVPTALALLLTLSVAWLLTPFSSPSVSTFILLAVSILVWISAVVITRRNRREIHSVTQLCANKRPHISDCSDPATDSGVGNAVAILTAVIVVAFLVGVDVTHSLNRMAKHMEPGSWWTGWGYRQQTTTSYRSWHLKEIGEGFAGYHDVAGQFPPSKRYGPIKREQHSWATHLLPFMGQQKVYESIQFGQPWNAPANRNPMQQEILFFTKYPGFRAAPVGDGTDEFGRIHFAGNQHLLGVDYRQSFPSIKDGASNTVLAGEIPTEFLPWGRPGNVRDTRLGVSQSRFGFGSHENSCLFLMADGTTRGLNKEIDAEVLRQLGNPRDGETINRR